MPRPLCIVAGGAVKIRIACKPVAVVDGLFRFLSFLWSLQRLVLSFEPENLLFQLSELHLRIGQLVHQVADRVVQLGILNLDRDIVDLLRGAGSGSYGSNRSSDAHFDSSLFSGRLNDVRFLWRMKLLHAVEHSELVRFLHDFPRIKLQTATVKRAKEQLGGVLRFVIGNKWRTACIKVFNDVALHQLFLLLSSFPRLSSRLRTVPLFFEIIVRFGRRVLNFVFVLVALVILGEEDRKCLVVVPAEPIRHEDVLLDGLRLFYSVEKLWLLIRPIEQRFARVGKGGNNRIDVIGLQEFKQ
jgi:hypothetical protein